MEDHQPTQTEQHTDEIPMGATDPLVELLTPESRVRILAALLASPTGLGVTDICEYAGISRNAWYDNKDALLETGVITHGPKHGNVQLYQVDRDHDLVQAIERVRDHAGAAYRDLDDE
jgi:hypothetical protein